MTVADDALEAALRTLLSHAARRARERVAAQ
jgi:hypothetical protein